MLYHKNRNETDSIFLWLGKCCACFARIALWPEVPFGGIITASTKSELIHAEAEKVRLQELSRVDNCLTSRIEDFLPHAADRYKQLSTNLSAALQSNIPEAREHLKTLIGTVKLYPSADSSHLEAEVQYSLEGLLSLASGEKFKSDLVAGAGFEPAAFRL